MFHRSDRQTWGGFAQSPSPAEARLLFPVSCGQRGSGGSEKYALLEDCNSRAVLRSLSPVHLVVCSWLAHLDRIWSLALKWSADYCKSEFGFASYRGPFPIPPLTFETQLELIYINSLREWNHELCPYSVGCSTITALSFCRLCTWNCEHYDMLDYANRLKSKVYRYRVLDTRCVNTCGRPS